MKDLKTKSWKKAREREREHTKWEDEQKIIRKVKEKKCIREKMGTESRSRKIVPKAKQNKRKKKMNKEKEKWRKGKKKKSEPERAKQSELEGKKRKREKVEEKGENRTLEKKGKRQDNAKIVRNSGKGRKVGR